MVSVQGVHFSVDPRERTTPDGCVGPRALSNLVSLDKALEYKHLERF